MTNNMNKELKTKPTTGELLRTAREAAGLSRQKAAAKMDGHISLIQNHERGLHLPSPRVLARYAAAYGVPVAKLVGRENETP